MRSWTAQDGAVSVALLIPAKPFGDYTECYEFSVIRDQHQGSATTREARSPPRASAHRLRQQLLQPGVLRLERLQPPRFGHLQAAVLLPPGIEGRVADAVLAAQLRRR